MMDIATTNTPAIVVTASRAKESADDTPASVSLIDADRIDRLGMPSVADLLRLVPSAAISASGPAGSLTDVRIRGAEANHTLLFVEGIRANDLAAGNIPRFELLNADLASRLEVVRGPQSALWGSEAIGGVVAVSGDAFGQTRALVEGGSFGTWRGAARASVGTADQSASIGIATQRSDGIDSFDGHGDHDGFRNAALRGSGRMSVAPGIALGGSGFALWGKNQFDGFNPATFQHDDTLDQSRNRLAAGRVFVEAGQRESRYVTASASLLGSSNRNYLDETFLNRTDAKRRTLGLEGGLHLGEQMLIAALEDERETFEARDDLYFGATDQGRIRRHQSLTLEWRAGGLGPVSGGVALRHDIFSRFKDATSLRASIRGALGGGFSLAGSYGEGIGQPSFFDLYGFFPGSFAGNPSLKPESSRGGEVSLRYRGSRAGAALTYYRQQLRQEIVDVFDPSTFLSTAANSDRKSRRQGVEVEADYQPTEHVRLTATYAFLDASEPSVAGGLVKEQRRPKHSGSIALDGTAGRLSYGASIAYVGAHVDTDFGSFPARRIRLGAYWLAGAQFAYRLAGPLEATLRVANAFDDDYQDVVGYRTEGRSVHAGFRVALGR
ncbi:MAG: TonB-dependent receptor [Sphingomonas sp.]|uniref:TonB-dependent receptor plug domain-containing protein n=1 Tax=Sphingomonas sp. TaxID=28214 RepID=UPI0017A0414F|nr:TonB-dependent receptor [Sphingomonas sp.]MBA3667678.1 TonB-dependent receptor [Sphingomonas sp.]